MTEQAEQVYSNLMASASGTELGALIQTNLSSGVRVSLLYSLLQGLRSKEALLTVTIDGVSTNQLSVEGGRSAWALGQLLVSEVPSLTAASTDQEVAKVTHIAFYKFLEAGVPTNEVVDTASLSLSNRLGLAVSEQTHPVVYAKLALDTETSVRLAVASNRKTPINTLNFLGKFDDDAVVKSAAQSNVWHNAAYRAQP